MMRRLLFLFSLLLLVSCTTAPSLQNEIAEELDSYARLLDDTGQTARSQEVAAQAAQMRALQEWRSREEQAAREGRAFETSCWLGFEPKEVLLQDAADRRRLGQMTEAERVEELAASYEAEQRAQIDRLIRQ